MGTRVSIGVQEISIGIKGESIGIKEVKRISHEEFRSIE